MERGKFTGILLGPLCAGRQDNRISYILKDKENAVQIFFYGSSSHEKTNTVSCCGGCDTVFCAVSFLQNIQKMLGLAPSRAATKQAGGFLGPPPQAAKFS